MKDIYKDDQFRNLRENMGKMRHAAAPRTVLKYLSNIYPYFFIHCEMKPMISDDNGVTLL
jgi:hypothetical protein